ncbi:MAG: NifU family protein [Deltaproteobacteria bacterium]|nr:NifU family protein [Deltaproteobacteria bacterium]
MGAHPNGAIPAATDEAIARVIEAFDGIVQPDGGRVSFIAIERGQLRIGYAPGVNPDCPTCVMEPDALGQMMLDMLQDQAPEIEGVVVDVVESGSAPGSADAIGRGA